MIGTVGGAYGPQKLLKYISLEPKGVLQYPDEKMAKKRAAVDTNLVIYSRNSMECQSQEICNFYTYILLYRQNYLDD